tara:strand:+ start:10199 stop:10708 length:510 start_codon:yes stop_codon:yes gene_type:complete
LSKNLVLTGMMGVGKSTIGKSLAKKLSYRFVDIDHIIETQEGCKINMIFKKKSEDYFRKLENKITLEELKKEKSVISLGGGAFMNKSIRKAVKKTSISFWLDVNLEILIKRLKNNEKRPLLDNNNLKTTIQKIYSERRGTYNEADFRVKCGSLRSDIISSKVYNLYENA